MRPITEQVASAEAARLGAVRRYDILDTPPDGAFDRITALAADYFDVPIAIVSIVDEDRIWFKSHHGLPAQEVSRDPGLCASAILEDKTWIVENAAVDPRTLANPLVAGELGLGFYAGAPLRTSDGHNLGTLCIIDLEPRKMNEQQIARLQDMARIVMDELELRLTAKEAIGVEQALREQSETVASTLQGSLLPPRLPEIPGAEIAAMLEPASRYEVGGDFYDCFALADDRWALMIGDVRGKGPEAAAVTGMVRHSARTAAIGGARPAGVLDVVNQVLLSAAEEIHGRLATLLFAEIVRAADGFDVEIARAGHPLAMVARGPEAAEEPIKRGPPLGAIAAAEFGCASTRIRPGDALLAYTDGLTEARLGRDFIGTSAVLSLLHQNHASTATTIIEAIGALTASADVRDDVAAVVFRVPPL